MRLPINQPRTSKQAPLALRLLVCTLLFSVLGACSEAPLDGGGPEVSGLEVASPTPHTLIFSAPLGQRTPAQGVTVRNTADVPLELSGVALAGEDAGAFALDAPPPLPLVINPGDSYTFAVSFAPQRAGSQGARLQLRTDGAPAGVDVALYGLGARGEGHLEPSLHEITQTLGYAVDVGGTQLVLGTATKPLGDEVVAPLFERATEAPVRLTPVARYGTKEAMSFGFLTLEGAQVRRHEVGRVAAEDAQRLLPPLQGGTGSWGPGDAAFGLYARAGGREQSSLDTLNEGAVARALRVYPLKDRAGRAVANSYLIGLEEAENGDYQDAVFVLSNVRPASTPLPPELEAPWRPLFNGRDLDGWYTYLPSKGVNHDPEGVFKVENGVLHILDVAQKGHREFGYLATEAMYEDYHLKLEYRWGEKRFAPRDRAKRDSGIIYHFTGPDKVWPRGVEYQIQEGDTGDFWLIGGTTLATTVASARASEPRYRQNGEPFESRPGNFVRIVKDGTHERLEGWNTAEVIVRGNTAVHLINGRVNNRAYSLFEPGPDGKPVALTRGRILLQAEGAEIFYRNVQIRPLGDD